MHADEDPEYLARIIEYFKAKTREVRKSAPGADSLKAAILAGIIVTDELFKERDKPRGSLPDADAEEAARIADRLIRQLDESLERTSLP